MSRPSDHIDAGREGFEPRDRPARGTPAGGSVVRGSSAATGARGRARGGMNAAVSFIRSAWRQLTSMRTALVLLLMLALAAVPGSLVPQRSSDPNGVATVKRDQPQLAEFYERVQLFDVYTSVWFTAVYLLLFVSLIGCIIPRIRHHWRALRSKPPTTPARLDRLDAYSTLTVSGQQTPDRGAVVARAAEILRERGYRTVLVDQGGRGVSVSAERGYIRETGNLVFHTALLGIIVSVGVLSGYSWHGQRVLVEGQTFENGIVSYSSFTPGRFTTSKSLTPYSMTLDSFTASYETENPEQAGTPTGYDANVTVRQPNGETQQQTVRVNEPLRTSGTDVYLLGNGYAPDIIVRDRDGREVFRDRVVFLPQDAQLTSLGVVKVPDGLEQQVGMIGFFYPTAMQLETGAFTSSNPDLNDPLLTLNVYVGDLGLDEGLPKSVYELDTDGMTQVAGMKADQKALQLRPGQTVELPNGLGTVSLGEVSRYASFDVHHDPTRLPVLTFTLLGIAGLLASLLVPRRRVWVRAVTRDEKLVIEYAGLARGEDARLVRAVNQLIDAHVVNLVGSSESVPEGESPPSEGDRPAPAEQDET